MKVIICFFLLLSSLNGGEIEEKIAHLMIVPACPTFGKTHLTDLKKLVKNGQVGGLIFMSGESETQLQWIETLEALSERRLFITQDAEWGPAMRLTDQTPFPKNLTLGAICDDELLLEAGRGIGRACHRAGLDMNLAPVCDVNLDPKNPIIGMRSFGDDPQEVAKKSALITLGMRETGLLTCAKHFPGHGNTNIDSHFDLPVISGDLEQASFQAAIDAGVDSVMVGHLLFPGIDELFPASLSQVIIEGLLRGQMGFDRLVISDSLCMRALVDRFSFDEIACGALRAGCDLLLFSSAIKEVVDGVLQSVPQMIEEIALSIPEERIDEKLSRLPTLHERREINGDEEALKRSLYRAALTEVGRFDPTCTVEVTGQSPELNGQIEALQARCCSFSLILFCSPYILADLPQVPALVAYEDNPWTREAVSDYLAGTLPASGKLPVRVLGEEKGASHDGSESSRRAGEI